MKLLTKELERQFQKIGRQEETSNPIVVAKFFCPVGAATWWATEYDPEDRIFFGYVTGLAYDEWGSFSLDELEQTRLRVPIHMINANTGKQDILKIPVGIERDMYWTPKPIKEALKEAGIPY